MEPKKRKVRIFRCRNNQTKEIASGIQYPNGKIKIGIDVWRELNRMDCASYPVETYDSIGAVTEKYSILPIAAKNSI